jgi:hypothetical protein
MEFFYGYSNEGSIRYLLILESLHNWQLPKKDSAL